MRGDRARFLFSGPWQLPVHAVLLVAPMDQVDPRRALGHQPVPHLVGRHLADRAVGRRAQVARDVAALDAVVWVIPQILHPSSPKNLRYLACTAISGPG